MYPHFHSSKHMYIATLCGVTLAAAKIKEVLRRYGVKERNAGGQMVVDFGKRMEMALVNI